MSAASPQVAAIGDGIGISLASLRRFWAVAARSNSSRARTRAGSARRRTAAVDGYVCDLVGSTARSTRFDPEDLRELIGDYDRAISETVGDFAGFVAKYMGDGGAGLFRVTYHRLGTLRARWHCAVPGPSTQATAHSVCVPHRIQPGDYDNKSLPFSRFSTSGGPKLSIRAPIVIPLVGSVGGLKLFATAAMENNLSTS